MLAVARDGGWTRLWMQGKAIRVWHHLILQHKATSVYAEGYLMFVCRQATAAAAASLQEDSDR